MSIQILRIFVQPELSTEDFKIKYSHDFMDNLDEYHNLPLLILMFQPINPSVFIKLYPRCNVFSTYLENVRVLVANLCLAVRQF